MHGVMDAWAGVEGKPWGGMSRRGVRGCVWVEGMLMGGIGGVC